MIRIKNGLRHLEVNVVYVKKEDSGEYEVYHQNHLSVVNKGNAWLLCPPPPELPLIMIKKNMDIFLIKKKSLI